MKGLWMHDDETMCSRAGCQHSEHTTPPSTPSGERIPGYTELEAGLHAQLLRLDKCDVFGEPTPPGCMCRTCLKRERDSARASEKALREALVRELDACFCDDVDGNCALPPGPECDRCQRIRATLAKQP